MHIDISRFSMPSTLLSLASLLSVTYPRGVLTEILNDGSRENEGNTREDEAYTPGFLRVHAPALDPCKNRNHDDLGATASEITPTTDDGVGRTDAPFFEHIGGPGLGLDKCRT